MKRKQESENNPVLHCATETDKNVVKSDALLDQHGPEENTSGHY